MKILEFGDKGKRKIILIHGFQSPWQVWKKYIEHYENDFHIIVPVMSGHYPAEDKDFVSFAEEAKKIEDFVTGAYGENVYAVYGMSMGGVLTATLWQNKNLKIEKVIFDGSPIVSVTKFVKGYMKKFYLDVTHKSQKRDAKTLEQAKYICSKEHFDFFLQVLDNMSDTTIVNSLNCIADFKLDSSIDTPDTTPYYFHGTAFNEMLAKKSAGYIKKHYPTTVVTCFKGKFHCENALFNPEVMISELDKILM